MNRADLHRRYADVIEMCEGTGVKPHECIKINGVNKLKHSPNFTYNEGNYQFAIGIIEDKPVFVSDVLYRKNDGEELIIIGEFQSRDYKERYTWTKPEPKKWGPKGGDWWIDSTGDARKRPTIDATKLFGHERETLQEAELAAIEMRKFNRLLAYYNEFAPKHDERYGIQRLTFAINSYLSVDIWMPNAMAAELTRGINSGEVTL